MLGRSTGAGALSIWTHHLKAINVISNYDSSSYNGPALYIGAGVIGAEAIEAAHAQGLSIVTGECPSVGLAGGFTQGGGHSTLSTSFGLAADQVLEYEVVTASGKILKASPEENDDLYWALSGGGGGTYAVVMGMTIRAYKTGNVGGGEIQLLASSTTPETYQEVFKRFHVLLPKMVEQGATVVYMLSPQFFKVGPLTIVNSTEEDVRKVAQPFLDVLEELGVPAEQEFTSLPFRDHFEKYLGPMPWGSLSSSEWQYGSRMIPRSAFDKDNAAVSSTLYDIASQGAMVVGTAGSFVPQHDVSNAVNPAWRDTLVQIQLLTSWNTEPDAWSTMIDLQQQMTDVLVPLLKKVTPSGASYMNEADFREADWKKEFFGKNYDRLLEIKNKWDPESLFYILKGVGSDAWDVDESGRMCRVHGKLLEL